MADKTTLRGYEIADILARHGLPRNVNGQTEAVARVILALERERDEARAALQPFAALAMLTEAQGERVIINVAHSDLRAARAAVEDGKHE